MMSDPELLPGSINQLPNEILHEIFHYIPTVELLWSCRLVSHTWHTAATFICRKRLVKIKRIAAAGRYVSNRRRLDILISKSGGDLPWSAVELNFDDVPHNREVCIQVRKGFGSSVLSLVTTVCSTQYSNFCEALGHMPNLEELQILSPHGPICAPTTRFTFPSSGKIHLPKLRYIEINYYNNYHFVDLLEFILRTAAKLRFLRIIGASRLLEAEFKRMIDLISEKNIPNLSLPLSYERSEFANWRILNEHSDLKIHELSIRLPLLQNEIQADGFFHVLEEFLAQDIVNNTLHLFFFDLDGQGPIVASKLLQFPVLRHLKHLKISLRLRYHGQYNPDPQFPAVCFNLFKATNFPNLQIVELDEIGHGPYTIHNEPYTTHYPWLVDIRKVFEPSDINGFDSVKFLNIGNYQAEGKLASMFPNLNKITTTVEGPRQLPPIFDDMKNLIEVDVTLSGNFNKNDLVVEVVGFIRYLRRLEKLTMRNNTEDNGPGKLEERAGRALTKLHPVNLKIYNFKVKETADFVTELRAVHPQVQFLEITVGRRQHRMSVISNVVTALMF